MSPLGCAAALPSRIACLNDGPIEVEVSGPLRSDNSELLLRAALAGIGVILLPDWLVREDLEAGRLTELLPGFVAEPSRADAIRAVWLANRRGSLKVNAFVSFLTAKVAAALNPGS